MCEVGNRTQMQGVDTTLIIDLNYIYSVENTYYKKKGKEKRQALQQMILIHVNGWRTPPMIEKEINKIGTVRAKSHRC